MDILQGTGLIQDFYCYLRQSCLGSNGDLSATPCPRCCVRVCGVVRHYSEYRNDTCIRGKRLAPGAEIDDVVRQVECRLARRRLRRKGKGADALEFHSCSR